jgi:hypothetical protein
MYFITFMLEDEHSRLSLRMLMHVKCIHDLCSLLSHILSYLIVFYKDLDLFSIDSGGLQNNPLLSSFNTVKQISLFLHIFEFQGTSEHQMDPNFLPCLFFHETQEMEKNKSIGDVTRAKRGPSMRATLRATWWDPSQALSVVSTQSCTPRIGFDLNRL